MRPKILRDEPQDIRTFRRSERGAESEEQKESQHEHAACLKVRRDGKKGFSQTSN
jgi:hypothetical protein